MKKLLNVALIGVLVVGSMSYASDSDMIEIGADAGTVSPFFDEEGNQLTATVVSLRQIDSENVEIQPVEVTENGIRALSTMSIRLSAPQIVSASWGVVFGTKKCFVTDDGGKDCSVEGLLFQIEPGLGGLKGSIGVARVSIDSQLKGMMDLPISAIDLKASGVRTWGLDTFAAPGQTYLGIEADVNVQMVKFSVGLLKKLEGQGADLLLSGGVGVGF